MAIWYIFGLKINHLATLFKTSTRNCLIGGSYQIKISDSAIYRPVYGSDYFNVTESNTEDILPLRWVSWEVYVMVSPFKTALKYFVANAFQIRPFRKGLAKQADVAFCFMPGAWH
jgi:hypothetical protein